MLHPQVSRHRAFTPICMSLSHGSESNDRFLHGATTFRADEGGIGQARYGPDAQDKAAIQLYCRCQLHSWNIETDLQSFL